MIALDTLEHATFADLVGQRFAVSVLDFSTTLELAEARILGARRQEATRDPFALTFRGQPGLRLPQGICRMENETLGVMEIFITQTADGPKGAEFEAIFT